MRERRFNVLFSPAAARDVKRLDTRAAVELVRDIKNYLEIRPIPIGESRIKKIVGVDPPLYRIRSGDFRAYYRVCNTEVVILAVVARKDSEKRLKRIAEEQSRRSYKTERLD
jgi:mRNA-degrading endonuclease RelE of RelBE toxin-antitoxin system